MKTLLITTIILLLSIGLKAQVYIFNGYNKTIVTEHNQTSTFNQTSKFIINYDTTQITLLENSKVFNFKILNSYSKNDMIFIRVRLNDGHLANMILENTGQYIVLSIIWDTGVCLIYNATIQIT